jgi:UrcA family protein
MLSTKILFGLAAVTASAGSLLLTVSPARAAEVTVVADAADAPPTATVRLEGLNLVDRSGQRMLSRRVASAVRQVCVAEDTGALASGFRDCLSTAWGDARPQMAAVIDRAQRLAASGTIAVAAGSISVRARP